MLFKLEASTFSKYKIFVVHCCSIFNFSGLAQTRKDDELQKRFIPLIPGAKNTQIIT